MYAPLVVVFVSAFAEMFVKELVDAIGLWGISCLCLGCIGMGCLVIYYTITTLHLSMEEHFHGCKSQMNNGKAYPCTCKKSK